jgi:enoyl-CoA hydratase/carnithine racemase
MSFSTLEFSIDHGIARIALNRPESANTISVELAEELLQAAIRCDGNPAVRSVILTGKGRFFSGGGDAQSFAAAAVGVGELLRRITAPLHAAVSRFARMDAPLVTAVNGTAAAQASVLPSPATSSSPRNLPSSPWRTPRLRCRPMAVARLICRDSSGSPAPKN